MTKRKASRVNTIASAVAIHLTTRDVACTAKQCMKELLEKVQSILSRNLTMKELQLALNKWLDEGWAILTDGFLQVTRAGRKEIKALAEKVTSPSATLLAS